MIQLLILNGMMIIATLQETGGDIGEPDCLLKEPYEVHLGPENELVVRPWLCEYTTQNEMKIHSDKITTIVEPNSKVLRAYLSCLK